MAWKKEGEGYVNDLGFHIFKVEDPQGGKALWGVFDLNNARVGDLHPTLKEAKESQES